MSIVFDRAVEYYDRTRALSQREQERVIDSLIEYGELKADSRILELGVGTGRIALPLAARGFRIAGVDLSLPMMAALWAKQPDRVRIDLARADATRLPFPSDTFDIVYAVHVLHLVAGWPEAIAEAIRVLKPAGRFLVNWQRRTSSAPNVNIHDELGRLARAHGVDTRRPGAQSEEEIMVELERLGVTAQKVNVIQYAQAKSCRELLDDIDRQIHSETWAIPRNVLDALLPDLEQFAIHKFGSLDQPVESEINFGWIVARK